MTITRDLLLAILSMDSYNRGYGAGLEDADATGGGLGVTDDTAIFRIGSAAIRFDSRDLADEDAGFYSIAYDTDYGTVISYRGTDATLDIQTSFNPAKRRSKRCRRHNQRDYKTSCPVSLMHQKSPQKHWAYE